MFSLQTFSNKSSVCYLCSPVYKQKQQCVCFALTAPEKVCQVIGSKYLFLFSVHMFVVFFSPPRARPHGDGAIKLYSATCRKTKQNVSTITKPHVETLWLLSCNFAAKAFYSSDTTAVRWRLKSVVRSLKSADNVQRGLSCFRESLEDVRKRRYSCTSDAGDLPSMSTCRLITSSKFHFFDLKKKKKKTGPVNELLL